MNRSRKLASKLIIPLCKPQPIRLFSSTPPKGGPQRGSSTGGYVSDDDDQQFESDRRFSNFILFTGAFALGVLFMASNVMQMRKQ